MKGFESKFSIHAEMMSPHEIISARLNRQIRLGLILEVVPPSAKGIRDHLYTKFSSSVKSYVSSKKRAEMNRDAS